MTRCGRPPCTLATTALVVLGRDAVAAHDHVAVGHPDLVGVERHAGARRAQLTTRPQYGSSPYERALHQLALGDLPGRHARRRRRWRRRSPAPARPWSRPRRRPPSARRGRQHDSVSAVRRPPTSAGPAVPLARTITVSLVDVQPSTMRRLNESSTAAASASLQHVGLDRGVGGEHRQHRGHVRARASPRPWPCRRPMKPPPATDASLATVSVVMIASAAAAPAVGRSSAPRAAGRPARTGPSAAGCR